MGMNVEDYFAKIMAVVDEIESESPLDFGMIQIDEITAKQIVVSGVVERLIDIESPEIRELIAGGIAAYLALENFILNQRIMRMIAERQQNV